MTASVTLKRCAIYTRKSSEEGLEQAFNSLDAQREACEAYVRSQHHEGWRVIAAQYNDGGFSGGTMERPALSTLIEHIQQGSIDAVIVYKVDRLSRSLADFTRIMERFDRQGVSFVSVTQHFNTSTSMGRLTLNVLLSFAQFEREVTGERIRDKIAASKQKGLWMGGPVPLGYDVIDRNLVVNEIEARVVQQIYEHYLALGCVRKLKAALDAQGIVSKRRTTQDGQSSGGRPFSRGALYTILKNPLYIGKVQHKGKFYDAQHAAIIDSGLWEHAQGRLAQNRRQRKLRATARNPSLLAGLLYDDCGNPMSPTHATKNGRRYRYYISQALLQFREQEAGSVIRLPAREIEVPVIKRLLELFSSPQVLYSTIDLKVPAHQQQPLMSRAQALVAEWDSTAPQERIRLLKALIYKITVGRNAIRIEINRSGLMTVLDLARLMSPASAHTDQDNIPVLTFPARLQRCGMELRLIVPADGVPAANEDTIKSLQATLAKALQWNQALISGEAHSMADIAHRENVTQRYVARVIRMAFLAPEYIQAIMKGAVPLELNSNQFRRPIPLEWGQQGCMLHFPQ